MGDAFQKLVDVEAPLEEAGRLGQVVLYDLWQRGVLERVPTDCVLGTGPGYRPRPSVADAVTVPMGFDWGLAVVGMEVVVGRNVHDPGPCEELVLSCPACGTPREPDVAWSEAVQQWCEGAGEGLLVCDRCGAAQPVSLWGHAPAWGYGNLAFVFWNWPPLKHEFVKHVAGLLHHRVVYVAGKL